MEPRARQILEELLLSDRTNGDVDQALKELASWIRGKKMRVNNSVPEPYYSLRLTHNETIESIAKELEA